MHCAFAPTAVHAFDPTANVIKLQGWRDAATKLWRFPICSVQHNTKMLDVPQLHCLHHANSVCDLPSIEALVKCHHATAGFPAPTAWCRAIANGNFATWPGLTVDAVQKYYPQTEATSMGTMSHSRKNKRSTKTKHASRTTAQPIDIAPLVSRDNQSEEVHLFICQSSKLHTDQTGKFPRVALSGNQHIMIAHAADPNVILAAAFKNKTKQQLTSTYLSIKKGLNKRGHNINLHVLDNEAPEN